MLKRVMFQNIIKFIYQMDINILQYMYHSMKMEFIPIVIIGQVMIVQQKVNRLAFIKS